jgi:hypothetical protein
MKKIATLIALVAPLSAQAQEVGTLLRFITCPVYRDADSGKKSGCWLADDPASGRRYDVSLSPSKPDWNFEVLVEGRLTAGDENPCGGAVLRPVRTSILPTSCTRHILPAEGFPGRRYKLQGRYIDPNSVPRAVPPGPYTARIFPVYFEWDRHFLVYQYDDFLLDRAVTWLRAAHPRKIVVTGFAATQAAQVSGQAIAEKPETARERAEEVSETLRRLLPGAVIETHWQGNAAPTDDADADTIPGQSQRRAEIRAVF